MRGPALTLQILTLAVSALVTACSTDGGSSILGELQHSFQAKGQANMDRLRQSKLQQLCSKLALDGSDANLSSELASIQEQMKGQIRYPANGHYLGDWRKGEIIAQTGKGFQFSDNPDKPAGGNCYACHQLSPNEISYGNIGPSLKGYGRLRDYSDSQIRLTWAKIYNAKAFHACSTMPRFGEQGILTEEQIRDVMALLFSPDSPVNQP